MTSLLAPWKLLVSFYEQNLPALCLSWGSLTPDLPRKLAGQGASCGYVHHASTAQHDKTHKRILIMVVARSKSTPWGACMCFLDKQTCGGLATPVGKSLAVKVQLTASRWEEEQSKLWHWLQFPLWTAPGFPGVTPSMVRLRRPQNSQHFAPVLPSLARLAVWLWRAQITRPRQQLGSRVKKRW